MADSLLGTQYMSAADFMLRATAFGASKIDTFSYAEVEALMSIASRAIDAHTGRPWDSATVTENHKFNLDTRRIKVNQPPILTLTSYVIRTSPGTVSTFAVTPVGVDSGGRNVRYGAIYYNYQENYLELASLALASGLTTPLIALGMYEPQVEISYTSNASVPDRVITATGIVAADMVATGYLRNLMGGASSVTVDKQSFSVPVVTPGIYPLPPMAIMLLAQLSRPAIG